MNESLNKWKAGWMDGCMEAWMDEQTWGKAESWIPETKQKLIRQAVHSPRWMTLGCGAEGSQPMSL